MSLKVLLADDHAMLRDSMRFMLEAELQCEVVGTASNGREAVEQAQARCPDIVVMDISMPELNGIEATRQILTHCAETRVIILSIHSTAEYIFQALDAGAHGYLLKASAGRELVQAIKTVQQGSRYLSPGISDTMVSDYLYHKRTSVSPARPAQRP